VVSSLQVLQLNLEKLNENWAKPVKYLWDRRNIQLMAPYKLSFVMAENRNCSTTFSRVSCMEFSQYMCKDFGATTRSHINGHAWPSHNVSHSTSNT
jgi:hypothetical protein